MKTSIVVLYILVTLSLIISLTTLLIVAQNNNLFAPSQPINPTNTPTPTAYPTNTPTATAPPMTSNPTATPPPAGSDLTLSYEETSRTEDSDTTHLTLTVTLQYVDGGEITLSYSQFYLNLYAPRMIIYFNEGTAPPLNSGTFTLGPHHQTEVFQLDFQFPSTTFNGMDTVGTVYQLQYNGTATINWTNQTYH